MGASLGPAIPGKSSRPWGAPTTYVRSLSATPWLHLKQSRTLNPRGISIAMNLSSARFIGWYYRNPTPVAVEGQRSFRV